jgi:hypothetical protein
LEGGEEEEEKKAREDRVKGRSWFHGIKMGEAHSLRGLRDDQ